MFDLTLIWLRELFKAAFRSTAPKPYQAYPRGKLYLEEDPMETLKKLSNFKILNLGHNSCTGEKMMVCLGGPNNFPQLQVLQIQQLYHLKELTAEEEGMP